MARRQKGYKQLRRLRRLLVFVTPVDLHVLHPVKSALQATEYKYVKHVIFRNVNLCVKCEKKYKSICDTTGPLVSSKRCVLLSVCICTSSSVQWLIPCCPNKYPQLSQTIEPEHKMSNKGDNFFKSFNQVTPHMINVFSNPPSSCCLCLCLCIRHHSMMSSITDASIHLHLIRDCI